MPHLAPTRLLPTAACSAQPLPISTRCWWPSLCPPSPVLLAHTVPTWDPVPVLLIHATTHVSTQLVSCSPTVMMRKPHTCANVHRAPTAAALLLPSTQALPMHRDGMVSQTTPQCPPSLVLKAAHTTHKLLGTQGTTARQSCYVAAAPTRTLHPTVQHHSHAILLPISPEKVLTALLAVSDPCFPAVLKAGSRSDCYCCCCSSSCSSPSLSVQ